MRDIRNTYVANLWKPMTITTRMVQKESDNVHEDETPQIKEYSMQDDKMAMSTKQKKRDN
eukprot:5787383-Ditylum_brightwellii.AAC.1